MEQDGDAIARKRLADLESRPRGSAMETRLLARMSPGAASAALNAKSSNGRSGTAKEKNPTKKSSSKASSLRPCRESSSSLMDATRREFLRSNQTRHAEPSSPSLSAIAGRESSSSIGRSASKSMLQSPSQIRGDASPRLRGGGSPNPDQVHALEQRLRDRAEISKLKDENVILQTKLEEVWASRESVQDVMETECRTLAKRMQEMEDQLCDIRTERDQLAKELQDTNSQKLQDQLSEIRAERDELAEQLEDTNSRSGGWEQALGDIHAELEVVREECTILKDELHASLLKQHELEQECSNLQEERELLEEEVVALMEAGVELASHKPESPVEVPKRTLSVEAAGPHLAGLEMIPEPKDQLDLTLLAEHILDTLQHGDELVEQQALTLLKAVYTNLLQQPGHSIIEMNTATDWAEVNICGDLGGQVNKLWEIIDINGYPEADNQYIFNGDVFWHDTHDTLQLLVALFALKTQQPDYVHILYRGSLDTLPQSSHLVVQLLTSMAQHLPFGAVLNQEVLILHKDLFDDAVSAHNTAPLPNPSESRRFTSTLIPDPVDTNSDPVFMQQLKGLEASTDATVAIIRVTPSAVLTPDNARFFMFRVTQLFKCIDYFAIDTNDSSTSSDCSPVSQEANRWAKPRKDKDTIKRSIPAPRSSIPKALPKATTESHRSAPKLAYNAPVRERQRKTDETEGQYRKKSSALPRSGLQAPVFKSKRLPSGRA